jgi:phytanoyl-CoA hydroxylase
MQNRPSDTLAAVQERFERDGFVHIENFLNPQELHEVETHLKDYLGSIVPTLAKSEAIYEDYDNPATLKQLFYMHLRDSFFSQLLGNPRIVGVAAALLKDRVTGKNVNYLNKPAGSGKPTPPHQDGFYYSLIPNEALTIWIALDDVDHENGALHYVKASHTRGLLSHSASNVLGFSQRLAGQNITEIGEEVTCQAKRGDCLIHHSLTVHSADGNRSKRTRRALALVYYAERAKIDEGAQQRYLESVTAQQKEQRILS